MSLFSGNNLWTPLAERMRPRSLEEIVGQEKLLTDTQSPFNKLRVSDNPEMVKLPSLILWGPPGTGKTTLAHIICNMTGAYFEKLSAIDAGVKDLRRIFLEARERKERLGERTLLFVDEIHRFSKSQQDSFLHALEAGDVTLIGATTENPSLELNNALLSRCKVVVLAPIDPEAVVTLLKKAIADRSHGLGELEINSEPEALEFIAIQSGGDARKALNTLEYCCENKTRGSHLSLQDAQNALEHTPLHYDKNGAYHYDLISALHKSIRNSNPQAAIFYLARMIEGGEDPLFITRRLIRAASEDIGLADPRALEIAVATHQATMHIGMPEADVILAECTLYLATAPKSNSLYMAIKKARALARENPNIQVPMHLRNAPTKLMKNLGFGENYLYDHDFLNHISPLESLPKEISNIIFYKPGNYGFEKDIQKRLDYFEEVRREAKKSLKDTSGNNT